MAVEACSFCGRNTSEVGHLIQNEEGTAAICSLCIDLFSQNVESQTVNLEEE